MRRSQRSVESRRNDYINGLCGLSVFCLYFGGHPAAATTHSVAFSQHSSSPHLIEDETFNDSGIINNLVDYEDGQEEPDSSIADKNETEKLLSKLSPSSSTQGFLKGSWMKYDFSSFEMVVPDSDKIKSPVISTVG
ncbi:uncharacterized protein TNCV_4653431 [Trichonephila clavipes]|nr:uncharacterized protein TNCV_4653431 [Trichonephila clavipes]